MLKAVIFLLVSFAFTLKANAQPSLSALLEAPAKESDAHFKKCEEELKVLPKAGKASPDDLINALKASPVYPKESAALMEALANAPMPTDPDDIEKSAKFLDHVPECWNSNSLAIQFLGAKTIIEQGTKRQKEDFTAALVSRVRLENKKAQPFLPLAVYLETLDELASAGLIVAAAKDAIHQAHVHTRDLINQFAEKYPAASEQKDPKKNN